MARMTMNVTEQNQLMGMDTQPQSYLTNYTENSTTAASHILQTMFVSDDDIQAMGSLTGKVKEWLRW